jgi:hypothetical protein
MKVPVTPGLSHAKRRHSGQSAVIEWLAPDEHPGKEPVERHCELQESFPRVLVFCILQGKLSFSPGRPPHASSPLFLLEWESPGICCSCLAHCDYDSRQVSALVHLNARAAHERCWSDRENKRGTGSDELYGGHFFSSQLMMRLRKYRGSSRVV